MNSTVQQQKNAGTLTVAELTYLIYFAIMFGARAAGLYEGMLLYNLTLVAGMLVFAVKVAMTRHTVLEYLLMGGLLLLSLIVYKNTGEKGLLLYFTMFLGMKGLSVRRIFKWATMILGTCFPVLVFLSVTGGIQDIYYIHQRAGFGEVMRRSLGYPYPNTLFTTYIVLMVLVMYMLGRQKPKNLLITSFLMLIGIVYLYIYSCSNTGLIVSVFYLCVNIYLQLRPRLTAVEKTGLFLIYPACLLISIVGPLAAKGTLFTLLDKILHNRVAYSYYYLTTEPVTLFGTRFKEPPNTNYLIDSSFLYSFLQIGVVAFVILTGLFIYMIYSNIKEERKPELAIIAAFCLLGLSDPFFFNLSYKNLMFLFVGEVYYRRLAEGKGKLPELFGKEIQLLSIGNKEISYRRGIYARLADLGNRIAAAVAAHTLPALGVYVLSSALLILAGFLVSGGGSITGAVDQIEEWEYVRAVLSFGLWGSILTAGIFLWIMERRKAGKHV